MGIGTGDFRYRILDLRLREAVVNHKLSIVNSMKLLLFDIDGTLIHANGAGKRVLAAALQDVFGTTGPLNSYDFSGKTDTRVVTELMDAAAIPASDIATQLPAVFERMTHYAAAAFPHDNIQPCPGVLSLLETLRQRSDVLLGLLTGNIEATATLKLAAAGIDPTLFRVGAYGSQHINRDHLPALAMHRANQLTQLFFTGENTVIIGDTPLDIQCARAGASKVIAVATGRYSMDTLHQYKPDSLFHNLTDTEAVLQTLLF